MITDTQPALEPVQHDAPAGGDARPNAEVYRCLLSALAGLIETRDTAAGDHLTRLRHYCRCIGEHLDPSRPPRRMALPAYVRLVAEASVLHDIGKAAVPDAVLLKPGRLTPEEFTVIRKHPAAGAATITAAIRRVGAHPFLTVAREIALSHHERWDGRGYPRGLSQERIPLSARIVAVADVFDALVSRRCYKQPIPVRRARQIIEAAGGSHFDPAVVRAFHRAGGPISAMAHSHSEAR